MTTISTTLRRLYTAEEYFELEKNSEVRHEFHYGKLIEMPGEAKKANRIAMNIYRKWIDLLEEKGYSVFTHDVKAEINPRNVYRYPDLVVAPEADDEDEYLVKQPVIMVEVASEGSWKTDSGIKIKEYTSLPTLKYYIIVSQEEMFVQVCVKEGNRWTVDFYDQIDEKIELREFNLSMAVSEIYNKVKFAENKSDI